MDLTQADDIALAIQARHLCTRMRDVTCFIPDEPGDRAARVLVERGFDYAPVAQDGAVIGHVRLVDLAIRSKEPVGGKLVALASTDLVSGDSAVAQLMGWLGVRPFIFVVEGRDIVGIVTPSDLNKQAGRTYFYLLVAGLEITLAERIRRRFPNQQQAVALLSPGRSQRVATRISDLARRDTLADPVAAMDMVDLMTIIKKSSDLLEDCGGYAAREWQRDVIEPINGLRNEVMHSVRALTHDDPESLRRLTATEATLRNLLRDMQAGSNGPVQGSPGSADQQTGREVLNP